MPLDLPPDLPPTAPPWTYPPKTYPPLNIPASGGHHWKQTDTCENITFPQLRWWAVTINMKNSKIAEMEFDRFTADTRERDRAGS